MMNKFKNGLGHSLVLAGMCLAMLLFMSHKSVAQEVGEVGYMYTPADQTTFRYVITTAADGEGNGGEVTVRKYNDAVSGAIVIPSSVTITVNEANITYAVTAVRADGFKNCASLTSVTFPSTVTSIGQNAFNNCSALASVSLVGSGVTSIGQNAFGGCSALTSVTLNDALSTIGRRAFRSSGLTSVTIPASVTSIGNGAFSNCGSLTSVTIQDGITSIGDSVFELSNLASVTFPSSVTSIGAYAFASCPLTSQGTLDLSNVTSLREGAFLRGYGMTSVTFSSSLTTIPQNAFRGRGLTSVTIPSSVTSIGNGAFYGCYNMTDVTFNRTESAPTIGTDAFDYQQKDVTTFHVPSGTLAAYKTALHWTTGGDSYYGVTYDILYFIQEGTGVQRRTVNGISYYAEDAINRKLTVYDINTAIANIPETLTGFGEGDELTQEYTVTKINLNRTNYRRTLEQLTVPATVTSINSTFENAFHLYYLKFLGATPPALCTSIFASCRSLDTIVVPAANLSAYSIAFSGYLYGGVAGNIVLSTVDNVPNMYIPMWGRDGIMYRITSANTMSVYRAFEKIYDGYSDYYTYMGSYNIPNTINKGGTNYNVTSIEKMAFRNLWILYTLNIAAQVSSIGDLAFYNCSQLQTLNISYPAVINSIGNSAFEACSSLRGNISFTI